MITDEIIKVVINQKGFATIFVVIFGILITGIVIIGAGLAGAIYGTAPQCPDIAAPARSDIQISEVLKTGPVTITNGEATALGQKYMTSQIEDGRVCFTKGLGHVSGKIKLGPVSPTFYISGGVDLSGSVPKATNLNIRVGAIPDNPITSSLVEKALNKFITESLSSINLDKIYTAEFAEGTLTVK